MSETRKPTLKQLAFAAAYIDPRAANGNGTLAARMAGYKGNPNQLAVQASVNLRSPAMQKLIEERKHELLAKALQSLSEAMDATVDRAFITKHGEVVYSNPRPDHKTRLEAAKLSLALLPTGAPVATESLAPAELPSDNSPLQVSEAVSSLAPADRAAIRDAAETEIELIQLERKQEDGDHDEAGTHQS